MTTAATDSPTAVAVGKRARVLGLDVARALAILGMVMVHFGPYEPDTSDVVGWLYRTTYGRASMLFVLLAGVGVSLLFGHSPGLGRAGRVDPADAWRKIGWRTVVFLPLGIALQALDTPVAVILQYYAAYYLLGAAGAMLPTRWLVALTGSWLVVGPTLYVTFNDPSLAGRGVSLDLLNPPAVVLDLLVTGFYPLITWGPAVLVGVLVGRTDLRDRASRWALLAGGAAVAAAAYGLSAFARGTSAAAEDSVYLLSEGHTGAPLNVIGAVGVAVAVVGLCLLLADALPRVTWPLAAVGQMALTVYVGHLLVLHVAPEWLEGRADVEQAIGRVARFYAITTVICVAWLSQTARGPLEYLLALPFRQRTAKVIPPTAGTPTWPPHNTNSQPPPSITYSTPAPRPSPPSTGTSSSPTGTPPPRP